jgi:hypothetical protein
MKRDKSLFWRLHFKPSFAQSSQFRAYNGTLPLMLNNFTDGFTGATAGTLRASVYVGDTCYDTTQKNCGDFINWWFKPFKCFLTLKATTPKSILEMFLITITTNSPLKI